MPRHQLVAVDTNLLVLLAEEDDLTQDAPDTIRSRLRPVQIVASPTAQEELLYKARHDPDPQMRELSAKAIRLRLLFREMDLPVPIIVSTIEVVRKFFR